MSHVITAVIMSVVSVSVRASDIEDIGWDGVTNVPSVSGCAAFYDKNIMEGAARYWGYIESVGQYSQWIRDNGYRGAVALYRSGDKGRKVYILWPDGIVDGPYLAIESVARHHYDLGISRNRVIDVDYKTAIEHGMRAPTNVVVLYDAGSIIDYALIGTGELSVPWRVDRYSGCIGNVEGN